MNRVGKVVLSVIVAAMAISPSAHAASVIADLSGDWSDANNPNSSNPNGTWQYREGSTNLPEVSAWTAAGTYSVNNQPAWAPSNNSGNFLPAEFKANSGSSSLFGADPNNPSQNNVAVGDVVMHTNDGFNGNPSLGIGNYLFTSNVTSAVDITGMVWDADLNQPSRSQAWNLLLNGVSIDNGSLSGTVSRSQAETFNLPEIIHAGDTVELELSETSTAGYFVGSSLTISAVPEPFSSGWNLGTLTLGVLVAAISRPRLRRRIA